MLCKYEHIGLPYIVFDSPHTRCKNFPLRQSQGNVEDQIADAFHQFHRECLHVGWTKYRIVGEVAFALLEGEDYNVGRLRYYWSSNNTEFMRATVIPSTARILESRIRRGAYRGQLEKYMEEIEGSDTQFAFYTDFKFIGESLL